MFGNKVVENVKFLMPRFKPIPSLYKLCVRVVYNVIYDICSSLELYKVRNKGPRLKELHTYLVEHYPQNILDDLLDLHSSNGHSNSQSLKSYYFYRAVTHHNARAFKARNYKLELSYWRVLFKTVFNNLISLNLALSCNDQILELIPKYCPQLEHLNATCKYERVEIGNNACTFALSVTDYGLGFLCQCKKLKTLTVNEPRSNTRGIQNGITYAGLRRLLIHVETLEDISYSDLGSVVAKDLDALESLRLKIIRHFNATEESIKEILRLCKNLSELYLTFFNSDSQCNIWSEIIKARPKLRALEVINLNCCTYFAEIFQSFGETLCFLSISSNYQTISFENLVTIARNCPNLQFLNCAHLTNRNEVVHRPRNFGQFSNLESLHLCGMSIDVANVVPFCTENAVNLEHLRIIEQGPVTTYMDNIFVESLKPEKIRHIEVSIKLPFTTFGIRKILAKFPLLNYLNVSCTDDCTMLMQELRDMNYDLVFINKVFIPFQQV